MANHGGAVINISSTAGRDVAPGFAAYGTAKAALSYLTRELAQDFAPKIRVNAISAGAVQTTAMISLLSKNVIDELAAKTPLGRLGEVEDVAACALYLASPAASFVTGEVYGVDGGITAPLIMTDRVKL